MAFINFWKLPASQYNPETHGGGIFQANDTGQTWIFGEQVNTGTLYIDESDEGGIGIDTKYALRKSGKLLDGGNFAYSDEGYLGNIQVLLDAMKEGKAIVYNVTEDKDQSQGINPNRMYMGLYDQNYLFLISYSVNNNRNGIIRTHQLTITPNEDSSGVNIDVTTRPDRFVYSNADTIPMGVTSEEYYTETDSVKDCINKIFQELKETNVDTKISEAIAPLETELENKVDSDTIASSTEYGLVKTSGEADESDGQNYDLKGTGNIPHVSIPLATTSKDGLMSAEDKANMGKLTNIQLEDLLAYGVEWDVTVADPTLTRIGNMQYHKTLPIQNGFKGCIYADGQIQYYLNPDDWRFREVPVYIEVSYNSDNNTLSSPGNFTDVVANANCYVDQYIKINNHICKITSASSNSITIPSTDINNEPVELESGTYTAEIGSCRNGADGIVCVEIPEFYYKAEADGNKHRMWVSSIQIDNTWSKQESLLIDAYKPTMRRVATAPSNGTNGGYITQMVQNDIISIANTDVVFRGGNNSTTYDSALSTDIFKTLLGKPLTNQSRVNVRTHMGNEIDTNQRLLSYDEYKNIFYWLYVIEYANFNSQAAYNGELTSEGYHQGGLGNGLTTGNWTNWSNYNGNNPITPCGYGDDLGNHTGIKQITVDMSGSITFDMPRWRGFDNPFGDIWTNLDGILIDTPLTGASDTGITPTCYIITNPSNYTDSLENIGSVYSRKHTLPHNEGFIKERYTGVNGDIAPISVGASTTTYSCDYYWVNYDDTPETLAVGGNLNDGSGAGLGNFNCHYGVSYSHAHVGFRTVRPKN